KNGYESLKIAVNLSGHVIMEPGAMEQIYALLEAFQVQPEELEIEVTETAIMLELNRAKECLHKLKDYGISIAIDDFGTGYSSLTYLHSLPFDVLKIDREFIKDVQKEEEESFIYKTVVELAHNMKLKVVAEGIETKEQKEFLLKNHCDIGQGFYFERPIPPDKIEPLLQRIIERGE
ncbi:MAG: EAL domain-containing protein, partial [Clostridiales bacterium]|nr:EAL domain-containing protein [Clostridiales bacterium]